jgi:hypothetical protein
VLDLEKRIIISTFKSLNSVFDICKTHNPYEYAFAMLFGGGVDFVQITDSYKFAVNDHHLNNIEVECLKEV